MRLNARGIFQMLSHSIPNLYSSQEQIKINSQVSRKPWVGRGYSSNSINKNKFSRVDKEFISSPMHFIAKKLRKPHLKLLNALAQCSIRCEFYISQTELAKLCGWSINSRTWVSIHLSELETMGLILKFYQREGVYSYILNPWFNDYKNIIELNQRFPDIFPNFQKVLIYNQTAVCGKNYTPNIEYKEDNSAPMQKREKIIYQGLTSKRDLLLKRLRNNSSINFRFNYPYQEELTICGMTMMVDVTIRKPKRGVPPDLAVETNTVVDDHVNAILIELDLEQHRSFFFNEKEKERFDAFEKDFGLYAQCFDTTESFDEMLN
jgi:hypothetical protein